MGGGAGGGSGCSAPGRQRGPSVRSRWRGEGASWPPPLPPGIRRRPGRRGAKAPLTVPACACQPPARPPRGGTLARRRTLRRPWAAAAAVGRTGLAPKPGRAPLRSGLFAPAPPRVRGPGACQVEEQLAADSRGPLLDPVPRKTSSVGFCWLAADSSGNASTSSEYLNSLPERFLNSGVVAGA